MVTLIKSAAEIPQVGLVLIDFFATWCMPCQRAAPVLVELSEKFPTVTFLKVDCDDSEELASTFSIRSLPTFVFLKDGEKVATIEGADMNAVYARLKALTA